jgi:hypothetical protein
MGWPWPVKLSSASWQPLARLTTALCHYAIVRPQSAKQDVRPMRDPEPQGQLRVGGDLIAHVAHVAVRP